MTWQFFRSGWWASAAVVCALSCGNDKPHPGSGEGGSAGAESGGSESGGNSGGFVSGGSGGSRGGGGPTAPCPEKNVGTGGAGGGGGAPNTDIDGAPCGSQTMYCITEDQRTCVCTQGHWLCFGGVDPISSTEVVLTGSYRDQDNQACATCAEAHCRNEENWPCERSGSPRECLHLLACQLESGCARAEGGVKSCYCGSADSDSACLYTSAANGACLREESTTFTAPLSALTNYFNLSSSSGAGNDFAQCLAAHCGACFRATEQNVCPTVSALSVDSSVYLGSSGHVSALASDPDQAPGALRYEWSVEPTTAAVFGDANAASTTFDCVTTGSAQVRLLVSDGDAACDWTFSRRFTCYDAPCLFNPLLASARAAFVGESISLSVAPRAFVPLLVEWSAVPDDVGTLVGDESGAATYTCGSTGVFTVTAQSTQGSCSVPLTVSLTCTTPAPPEARIPDSTESALRRTYQGEDRQECWSCAAASPCLDAEAITACEWRADPAERVLCLRLLQCELESGCAQDGWSCYCNTSDGCFAGPSAGAGVCRAELEAALQTSNPNVVATHSTDPALPGAQATILAQCLAQSGCESCFPPRNRCPVIDSVSVDPSAATIGETIALRVTATDPDDGPNPVGYYWIASHTDAGFLGSIAEPSQAETSFTCERAETGEVVVTATDGLCGDVRYVPVTCLAGGG